MNLKGDYNLENILAAVLISLTQGVKLETIERALKEFKPLAHRMESIREIEGIEFLDDSKATNIDATKRALESIDKMVVLIAGGRSKGSDFGAIRDQIRSKVKKMILIGEAAPLIEKAFSNIVETERALTLEDATSRAYKVAKKNEVVLLSPMCSSFDMFRDYEHRGEVFCQTVRKI
jgi:UDP-N-acetylmuramoylalanine--D-glutamate ligase